MAATWGHSEPQLLPRLVPQNNAWRARSRGSKWRRIDCCSSIVSINCWVRGFDRSPPVAVTLRYLRDVPSASFFHEPFGLQFSSTNILTDNARNDITIMWKCACVTVCESQRKVNKVCKLVQYMHPVFNSYFTVIGHQLLNLRRGPKLILYRKVLQICWELGTPILP